MRSSKFRSLIIAVILISTAALAACSGQVDLRTGRRNQAQLESGIELELGISDSDSSLPERSSRDQRIPINQSPFLLVAAVLGILLVVGAAASQIRR